MTNEQVKSSKKITVGLIVSWIFGILFALTGFISVFSEPIPGIVMLIMGAVLLPPVNKFVDEKWKFHLSGGMKAVVLIIGFIIFGSTVDTSKQQSNQAPAQQEQSVSTTEQKKDEIKPTEDKKTLILDLPNIGNKTEKEVEAILGKADRTEKVKGYPCEETNCQRAFYNTDKIEIIFKEGKANRITVNGTSDFTSKDNALENLGLKIEKPTFKNPTNVIRWENVQNFAEISFFTDYILIQVSNPTPNEKPEPIK